jgi:hypothetical protein
MNRDTDTARLRQYWRAFLPLSIILTLMINFPLRIDLRESFYDALFYGTISLICIATTILVYRRFGKQGRYLIAVILLCSLLSGWQIFDLVILRYERPPSVSFAYASNTFEPFDHEWAWYGLRFRSPDIMCHSLYERYFGNHLISITLEIKRDVSWYACGG